MIYCSLRGISAHLHIAFPSHTVINASALSFSLSDECIILRIKSYDNTVPYLISYHSLKANVYIKKTHYVCTVFHLLAIWQLRYYWNLKQRKEQQFNILYYFGGIAIALYWSLLSKRIKEKKILTLSNQHKYWNNPTYIFRNIKNTS